MHASHSTLVRGLDADIGLRSMTQADIPLGLRLKALAGWNQTAADWRLLLAEGVGWVATYGGAEVGTTTVLPYGDVFSWIGMVLVDPAYRRRGIGTALLRRAVDVARAQGTPRLDATPQGVSLYEGLGFRVEYGLMRMRRAATVSPELAPAVSGRELHPLLLGGLDDVIAFDGPVFGADRGGVLYALWHRAPDRAFFCADAGGLCGFCLGRSGSEHDQIGPVVAASPDIARALVVAALQASPGRATLIDVPDDRPDWLAALRAIGFRGLRPFTRMAQAAEPRFGDPARQFAVAGPELG